VAGSRVRTGLAVAVVFGLGLLATVITSGLATPARAADPVITIRSFAFEGNLTVAPGATVTVVNADRAPHTLTAVDHSFTTPVIQPGESATFTAPTTPGTYAITCNIHPTMSGNLTVSTERPPTTEPPTPTTPPTPTASPTPSPTPTPTPTVSPTPTPTPTGLVITITGFAYRGNLTVTPGAVVTVINADRAPHTLTAADGTFTTPVIAGGQSATFTAPRTPGVWAITCTIHPSMSGILTVKPSPTASPAPTPTGPLITITDFAFRGNLTVAPGAVVTVVNADRAPHTVTAADGSFTTPVLRTGQSATFVAPRTPGSWAITCTVHPSMSGILTVKA
jgi:plastocyanin